MSKILDFFADWKVKLTALAIVIFGAFFWHVSEVKVAVNQAVTQVETQYKQEIFKLNERASTASADLKRQSEQNLKEKKRELEIANSKYNALLDSVRNRPDRPSGSDLPGNPGDSESTEGATGMQLYRSDAVLLSWFADQTSQLQINLNACYKDYDAVKQKLEEFRAANSPKTK